MVVRNMANLPFGLDKILGEPDNKIPTDEMRRTKKGYIPEFAPDDLKKEMAELGIDGIEELDELEEKNMEGYNNLGLVPPKVRGHLNHPSLSQVGWIVVWWGTVIRPLMPCFGLQSKMMRIRITLRTLVYSSRCYTSRMRTPLPTTEQSEF